MGAKREHKQSKHKFDRKRACLCEGKGERERVKVVKVKVQAKKQIRLGIRSERGGQNSETIRQIVTAPGTCTKSYTAQTAVRWVK